MIKFEKYLSDLLGEKEKAKLMQRIRNGDLILVSGPNCSGKTTLVRLLREHGYSAVEDSRVFELKLTEKLNVMIPDIRDTVE